MKHRGSRFVDVLSARSTHEYAGVLRTGLKGRKLDEDRVSKWSRSRRLMLRAALARAGIELEVPEPRRVHRKDPNIPVEEELVAYEQAAGEFPPERQAIALLPLRMGLRAQELLQLHRKDVQRALKVGELSFLRKANYEARLPARHAADLWKVLLETPSSCGGAWGRVGEILTCATPHTQYCALRRLVRRAGRLAGIHGLRAHSLRHGFATRMMRKGAPLPVLQKWLGHAHIQTTMIYLHPELRDLEKWA